MLAVSQQPAALPAVVLSDIHHLSIPAPVKFLKTSLPGELRLAPHTPSPGWHAFVIIAIITNSRYPHR